MTELETVIRLEDCRDICNLMGRFSFLETAGDVSALLALFTDRSHGSQIEVAGGDIWAGRDAIARYFEGFQSHGSAGVLIIHALTTAKIVIADDRRSAEGTWVSPGVETLRSEAGDLQPLWTWSDLSVRFVRERAEWWIQRLTISPIVKVPPLANWANDNWLNRSDPLILGRGGTGRSGLRSAFRANGHEQ